MKMINIFYIVYCLLFSVTFSFGSNLEVEFFNVGQGHCTLVYFKEGPPFLVDAGSSEIPGDSVSEKNTFKTRQLATIADAIRTRGKTTNKNKWKVDINVIISHGDGDHYNWVTELFDRFTSTLRIRFLLGGKKDDYNKTLQDLVKLHEKVGEPSYVSECGDDLSKISPFVCHESTCSILSAEVTADKNQSSIVIKVADNGPMGNSVILAGDATGRTTKSILEAHAENLTFLKTTILQASHHGADSDGSNSEDWFTTTSPAYVVISAGTRRDYMHPKQKTLENALKSTSLKKDVRVHTLQYNFTRPFCDYQRMLRKPKTVFRLSNDYLMAVTKIGIFNTFNQGNIRFTGADIVCEKKFKKGAAYIESSKDMIFSLLNEAAFAEQIIAVNFPQMILSTSEFRALREALEKSSSFLSCDFSKVSLDNGDFTSEFEEFFQKLTKLQEIVFFNGLGEPTQQTIRGLWGHRGLIFSYN